MIIVGNGAFCQQYLHSIKKKPVDKPIFSAYKPLFSQTPLLQILPANFYCSQLGFFCKKEWKFEAVTKLPFKFRLGSIQYNDWLEGKKNAGILPAP